MKKIILSIGSMVSVVAPIASVVACGDSKTQPTPHDYIVPIGTEFAARSAIETTTPGKYTISISQANINRIKSEAIDWILRLTNASKTNVQTITVMFTSTFNSKKYLTTADFTIKDTTINPTANKSEWIANLNDPNINSLLGMEE